MKSEHYSKFTGIDRTTNRVDAPQVSFLKLDNILLTENDGELVRRGGSTGWSATGDILGLFGYSQASASYLTPNAQHTLRHRRNGSTSFIEKLNESTSSWTALTLGANAAFSASGIADVAQYNNMLCICAGQPAFIDSITSDVNRLGGPAPTTAPTWGSSGTGLTGSTRGFYTFYDSVTGWESSPSPITSLTTFSNKQIDWSALETTVAKEGVDKKRLYRTELTTEGDGTFKLVATINLATTTYADTIADASLGADAPELGDHDPPPSTSFICATYANKFFIASGNELWYSKTFDRSTNSLQYFSEDRVEVFPARITGLAYTPDFGKLLVFLPAGLGIHYVSGRSDGTFQVDVFKDKEGTNFPASVSCHDDQVAYWGPSGPSIINPSGTVKNFARGLYDMLREIVEKNFNSTVYVFSEYVPYPRPYFLWGVSGIDTAGTLWEDTVTETTIEWEDSVTGALIEWEIN